MTTPDACALRAAGMTAADRASTPLAGVLPLPQVPLEERRVRLPLAVPPALIAVAASLALAGPAAAAPATVTVNSDYFDAGNVTVNVGDSVTWNWNAGTHDVSFKSGPAAIGTSPWGNKGATWSANFTKAGTYTYVCEAHPGMKGTVTVVDAPASGAPAPSPAAAPAPAAGGSSAAPSASAAAASPLAPNLPAVDAAPPAVRRVSYRRNRLRVSVSEPGRLQLRYVPLDRRAHIVDLETVGVRAGDNVLALRRWMRPGRYRISILALDAAGNASRPLHMRLLVRR